MQQYEGHHAVWLLTLSFGLTHPLSLWHGLLYAADAVTSYLVLLKISRHSVWTNRVILFRQHCVVL